MLNAKCNGLIGGKSERDGRTVSSLSSQRAAFWWRVSSACGRWVKQWEEEGIEAGRESIKQTKAQEESDANAG